MHILENKLYLEQLSLLANETFPYENLREKSILITGATGLIGSCLIDFLIFINKKFDLQLKIYAVSRSAIKMKNRFCVNGDDCIYFLEQDVNVPFSSVFKNLKIDFLFHLASNTHPIQYATDPIGTINTNIIGTNNLLSLATKNKISKILFASSVEIYGENRGDCDLFNESYLGYIDCNTLRAGYPESKRVGEALCQAYIKQNGLNIVIPRLARTYGPTMLLTDSKAMSQFIKNGLNKENIILKSDGLQNYTYTYVLDAVKGILYSFFRGECGNVYNIGGDNITLKELASKIADFSHTKVIFQLPNNIESSGYSKATKALLDDSKLQKLGFNSNWNIDDGLKSTLSILKDIY